MTATNLQGNSSPSAQPLRKSLDLVKSNDPVDDSSIGKKPSSFKRVESNNSGACFKDEIKSPEAIAASSIYGYEDASPDAKYGYEDAAPDSNFVDEYSAPLSSSQDFSVPRPSDGHRQSRRSSLKQPGSSPRRRASMGIEYEIHVLGRRQPVRRRSSITFDEKVQVKPVIPLKDLAGDEAEKLWFQDDEFTHMREKSWKIVEEELEARSSDSGRGTRYCTRGLEQMINSEQAIQQTKAYVASVLNEQDMQRRTCAYDQEYMAKLAQFVTLASQEEARLRAKTDEQEMERINRRALRRKSTMM